jgi:signal transduction histidine kinase
MDTYNQEYTSTTSIIVDRLSRAELFVELSELDLIAMANYCVENDCNEGDILITEGEPADKMFVVERGKVALEKKVDLGRHTTPRTATIGYVEPNKVAGISALAAPYIYTTSAMCVESTRVITIDGLKLRKYLLEHPDAGLKIMNALASIISDRYLRSTHTLTYFLSIVSHELRSPLAAIENYLQTILGGYAGELNQKQIRMIQRSILRLIDMRGLIGDVVDLARMRPEQIQTDFEWFDPSEVGTESLEDVRLAAAEKGIKILVDPPERFEPIIGARRRMRQVFTNLLNNAIKFSPPEATVYFRARYEPNAVIFNVEDQGPGIPVDEMEDIFKDFYRGVNVGDSPGTGMGLSIAKKIVDAHYGDIKIENIIDESGGILGTCFTVSIPRNLKTPEMRRREWK